MRQHRSENPGKRVKIAILDTGIDTRNVAFARHVSKGLIKVEDFVAPGSNGLDMNGHGTHSAALLCKIAPEAEIYVAKVVGSKKHPPSPSLVAKVRDLELIQGNAVLTWSSHFRPSIELLHRGLAKTGYLTGMSISSLYL